jgi:prolyl-tRNA editing enzyme YbaK/EbsC (Cys-tRNA(Pro) deacylase)
MAYHPVVSQIIELLKSHNFWFETFEHEAVRTSEEAAKVRHGYELRQGAKSLILRIRKNGEKYFVNVIIPGSERFNNSRFQELLGTKDIRFATQEEASEITGGIEFGGVPPFGNLFGLPVYVDKKLLENEKIIFNAGDRRFSVALLSKDWVTLVQPEIVAIL